MSEAEVEKHDLEERPVLFVVIGFDESGLQLFHLLKALWQFGDDEQSDELHKLVWSHLIGDEDQNVNSIDDQTSL
jgi:hypothetical protein